MTKMTRSILLSGLLSLVLGGCSVPGNVGPDQSQQNASLPGWTGRTFVPGSTSTIAGDATATYDQQKWQLERGR